MRRESAFGLCKHMIGAVWAKSYGKVLITSWVINMIYLFGVVRRRRRFKEKKKVVSKKKKEKKKGKNDLYDIITLVMSKKGFFTSKLFRHFVLYVVSLCTRVYVTVKLSDLGGDIAGYFGAKRFTKMFETQARFGLFAILAAANTMAMKFLQKRVEFRLRDELTKVLMTEYLEGNSILSLIHMHTHTHTHTTTYAHRDNNTVLSYVTSGRTISTYDRSKNL